jgi:uncharacterized repeat protein (TIGR03806 family)
MKRIKRRTLIGVFLSTIILWGGCQQLPTTGVHLDISQKPFERLSQYQFFVGEMKNLEPNDRVLPYDLNSPLFSDYADKSRFVWMPEGMAATYREDRAFAFPVGAVLIKNFFYKNHGNEGRRIVETRLLINRESGWDAMTYVWDDQQTEAYLNIVGDSKELVYNGQPFTYLVPNRNQCKSCHSYDGQMMPNGPKAHQLNKTFPYADGEMNQLDKWAAKGYLIGYQSSDKIPAAAQWDNPQSGNIHDRAMGYLDSNCGHCHNPHGPANTSGLNLTYNEPVGINMGVNKSPVATGKGSGGRRYSIVPGQPDASILVYRMEATDPGAMMPELGRQLVHQEGVALIKEWIAGME